MRHEKDDYSCDSLSLRLFDADMTHMTVAEKMKMMTGLIHKYNTSLAL